MDARNNDPVLNHCVVRIDPSQCVDRDRKTQINVGPTERVCSVLAGGTLAARGLSEGRANGWCHVLAGSALIWRGLTGWCRVYQALGIGTTDHSRPSQPDAVVDRTQVVTDEPESVEVRALTTIPEPEARPHLQVGDTVWDATGQKRGRVVDVEDLPIGLADPADWCGASFEVEWEDEWEPEPQCQGQFVLNERALISSDDSLLLINSDWQNPDESFVSSSDTAIQRGGCDR